LSITREEAIVKAKEYIKTLTYQISGQSVSGFATFNEPIKIPDFAAHNRGNSVELYPYWYVQFRLTQTYDGGINEVSVGVWGDTAKIADYQFLADGVEVAPS
jgi:hypothetical protein